MATFWSQNLKSSKVAIISLFKTNEILLLLTYKNHGFQTRWLFLYFLIDSVGSGHEYHHHYLAIQQSGEPCSRKQ